MKTGTITRDRLDVKLIHMTDHEDVFTMKSPLIDNDDNMQPTTFFDI